MGEEKLGLSTRVHPSELNEKKKERKKEKKADFRASVEKKALRLLWAPSLFNRMKLSGLVEKKWAM